MSDMPMIAELEARIASALGRIGQGLERLPAAVAGDGTGDTAALQEALEAERTAVAQLAERLRMVKEREAASRAALEAQVTALTETRDQQEQELQRLRAALAQTDEAASTAGLQDGNADLLAELEALRAERRSESAEMEAILSALVPLIEEPRAHA